MAHQPNECSSNNNNNEVLTDSESSIVDLEKGDIDIDRTNDVFLTWEKVGVTVSSRQHGRRRILEDITGYAQPGEILAIMGPSGSGKTTLLDALAGRLDSSAKQTGQVLINGRKQPLAYGTSAYVGQEDVITWTLTVREAVYYSAQLQLPNTMSLSDKKNRAETTIKEMGLQDSMDVRIGGFGMKSLSGGQKRRVTICTEILTRPKLIFLDEPTSGLDSAASYYVMKKMADLAREHRMTTVVSIHQPSDGVFRLFDNLCLLSCGRTIYFGPCDGANKFFETNGFPCPNQQNVCDHYLRMINTDFDEDMERSFGANENREEVINMLVTSYKSSLTCKKIGNIVSEICRQERGELKKGCQAKLVTSDEASPKFK